MFGSSAPETGAKVSVRFTVTSTGYVALNVTVAVDCVAGFAVAGKPVIVRVGAAGKAIVRFNVSLVVSPPLSLTVTVIDDVPNAVGVPLSVPVELIVIPDGNPVAFHIKGGVPPVAPKANEKEVPSVGGEIPVVVIFKGAAAIVTKKLAVAVTPAPSFTVTVTVNGPGEVGVPLRAPLVDNVTPGGNPPAVQV
jgi:hypothetical protein